MTHLWIQHLPHRWALVEEVQISGNHRWHYWVCPACDSKILASDNLDLELATEPSLTNDPAEIERRREAFASAGPRSLVGLSSEGLRLLKCCREMRARRDLAHVAEVMKE